MRFRSFAPAVALLAMSMAIPASAQMAQVAGDWEFEFESPRGAQTITLTFVQDGATLGGEAKMMMMQGREMQMDIEGKVEAMKVEFSFVFTPPAGGGGRAGAGAGGAGRGGAGGRGAGGGFAFAGDLVNGELRGKLTTGRGGPVDVVLKRPATR